MQLIIENLLQNMMRYKPIKYTMIFAIAIKENANSIANDEIPIILQQFNVTADDIRVRVANVLTNFLKPSIRVTHMDNRLYLDKLTLNQHLDAKTQQQ